MLSRRSAIDLRVFVGLFLITSLGERQLFTPPAAHAQGDSSKSTQIPASQPPAPAAKGTPAARKLFRQQCGKCHGADGTGSPARDTQPKIPNFTAASWQAQRSDAQLLASVLEGKGLEMPSFRGKIRKEQARGLVAYVRAFAPTTGKTGKKEQEGPAAASFEEGYRRLQEQQNELRRQFHELSKVSPGGTPAKASDSPQPKTTRPPAPVAAGTPAIPELFRQHCMKCHGSDGTGSAARSHMPKIPNFTDVSWQKEHQAAQLLTSVLDGKGSDMPPARQKVSEEQARELVAYVQAFAPAKERPQGSTQSGYSVRGPDREEGQVRGRSATPIISKAVLDSQREETIPADDAVANPAGGFFEKLIRWLGKFHPPAVHFPIALLTAATLAELLRMATGNPAFDFVSRYCVCLGFLTAVAAGALGWFRGGFHLTDASWVLMTHRWLGTFTVACTGLVLVLSEVSCRPDRRRTRMWFRATLLVVTGFVLVTGFFGGAVVFGLAHYTWPQ
jgi:mono/diheme cytochrome c family protein/uncharacterized membrane protein